jgi:hypothetical protein
MNKKIEKQIERIEETQGALRESIEKAKALAEVAHKLVEDHKQTLRDQLDD